jgi:hypothetical protein
MTIARTERRETIMKGNAINAIVFALGLAASGMSLAQSTDQPDPGQAADEQAQASLCSYVVGETTFNTFQNDFTGYFTRQSSRDPDSAPGLLLKPLFWEKSVSAPPDKAHLMMAMFGKESVPEELTPYVSGKYLLGHLLPGKPSTMYQLSPDSFSVLAALAFKDGVLAGMEFTGCPQ